MAGHSTVSVVSYTWYASATGERIQADMTFNAGRRYHVNMILQCEEGYYIADDEELDAYVNGEKAYVSAQDGNRTTLTVGYTVPVASGVRGQVTSFMNDGDVTVSLFAAGSAEPQYTVAVPAGEKNGGKYTAVYDIPEVAAGTYTMKVMKQNHVTREYTVTVGSSNVVQDVEIWLLGDVNGDGTINAKDKKIIYGHINDSTTELTGYIFDVGDVNKDGVINAKDKKQIFGHINGTSLWS
ncbi:dockerin type I repeat-containing protein [Enterocloster bolteae]|uniref:dockerin type I repeat-containing protein n=1 Tax=Enterocloster bolteae TaxID=208479 RepID=UPI00189FA49C|nr:dockerin type I repeat-containing protein [Enterocloster bolteae]